MAAPSLLERAQDGDATAIAALLTQALKPKGITVRGDRQSYTLHLWFTGSPAPPQPATVAYARRALERLQVPTLGILHLYGEQPGLTQPAWSEEISLLALSSTRALDEVAPVAKDSSTPAPQADPGAEFPPLEPVDDRAPGAVARAYQELGLALGAPLAQVESVYFKRRAVLLRQSDRAALEPLKWAFTTLKTHLEQPTVEAEPASFAALGQDPRVETAAPRPESRPESLLPRPQSPSRPHVTPPDDHPDDTDLLSFQNRYTNGLIFPVLMVLGMLMNALPIVNGLLFGIKIWFHELGHATIAWLAGRQALPLPIGWTSYNPQRSPWVYLGLLTLLGLLFWAGRREGKRWPMVLAVILAGVQFVFTWLLSANTFTLLFSFGGIGGEIYLAALLIVGFYFPLPEYFRWDFYRFPVVLGAAFCFWGQLWLWQQIPRGKASIPFGSMWGEAEQGDMNQLVNTYGWTPGDIMGTYGAIAHLCLFAIVAVYGYTLFRQHRDIFIALGKQWLP